MKKCTLFALLICLFPMVDYAQTTFSLSIVGHDAMCNGATTGSAKVTVTGGIAPYTYSWSPVAGTTDSMNGLLPGTYYVTVTDSTGTAVQDSILISQPPPLVVYIDSIVVLPCFRTMSLPGSCGCSNTLWAVVSGGVPPYSYLWNADTCTSDTLHGACYNEYSVTVTDQHSCLVMDSLLVVIPVTVPTGIKPQSIVEAGIDIYPNPVNTLLTISVNPADGANALEAYNMAGARILRQTLSSNENTIGLDVSILSEGNYILKSVGGVVQSVKTFTISR